MPLHFKGLMAVFPGEHGLASCHVISCICFILLHTIGTSQNSLCPSEHHLSCTFPLSSSVDIHHRTMPDSIVLKFNMFTDLCLFFLLARLSDCDPNCFLSSALSCCFIFSHCKHITHISVWLYSFQFYVYFVLHLHWLSFSVYITKIFTQLVHILIHLYLIILVYYYACWTWNGLFCFIYQTYLALHQGGMYLVAIDRE